MLKRGLLIAVIGLILAVIVVWDSGHAALTWVLGVSEPLIAAHPFAGALAFVALAAASAMLAFFSSAVLVPIALDAWGLGLTMILLWVGWTVGGIGAYGVARYLGRPTVTLIASGALLERYEDRVSAHTPFGMVLLFQIALPSEVPGYILGLARYPFGRFVLALALAEVPFAVLTAYVGAGLVERHLIMLFGAGAAALLLSGVALLVFRKRLRSRRSKKAQP